MASSVLAAGAAILSWVIYSTVTSLRSNITKARKTGLPYVVTPINPINILSQLTHQIWVPLVKRLPKSWWENWIFFMIPNWEYHTGQQHFERLGTETFIAVAPYTMILYTCSAEVIHQMTSRREAFPKDTAMYSVLALFGRNILTTEGAIWKVHRKATSASFNEKNAAHTFAEAIHQTRGLISRYFGDHQQQSGSTKTITSLEKDTMTWALNIIGYVGFGLHLLWPGEKPPADLDPKVAKYGSLDPPPGYTLSFGQSLGLVLDRIMALLIVPSPLLKVLPFEFARQARSAKENYLRYMEEFLRTKTDDIQKGVKQPEGMDIMGQLVRSSYGLDGNSSRAKLDDSEIIGDAFIMTLAGHETTANTLHFTLVELATNPAAQRALQADIDSLLKGSDPSTWDYDKLLNPMMASHIGACVNESLRVIPPVTSLPKIVSPDSDQVITIGGNKHVLPAGLSILLLSVNVHRNPHWWPTKPSERTGAPTDLDEYLPERWYRATKTEYEQENSAEEEDGGEEGGYQGSNTSASLYRPIRGSYIPFSDGPRSCVGRRIAMVEMIAAVAVLFQKYSVELAVDAWADDDQVDGMSDEEKRSLYAKAQETARRTIDEATTILTLKLNDGKYIPVRIVKRGHERFVSDPELS